MKKIECNVLVSDAEILRSIMEQVVINSNGQDSQVTVSVMLWPPHGVGFEKSVQTLLQCNNMTCIYTRSWQAWDDCKVCGIWTLYGACVYLITWRKYH